MAQCIAYHLQVLSAVWGGKGWEGVLLKIWQPAIASIELRLPGHWGIAMRQREEDKNGNVIRFVARQLSATNYRKPVSVLHPTSSFYAIRYDADTKVCKYRIVVPVR